MVDPEQLYRSALARMLTAESVEVVAEVDTVDQLVENPRLIPDIDLALIRAVPETADRLDLARIREAHNDAKIVLIAGQRPDPDLVEAALAEGADGILHSGFSPEAFFQCLRLVVLGEQVLPLEIAAPALGARRQSRAVPARIRETGLTDREIQILELLAGGYANKEIAIDLDISEATVKVHVKAILKKIGVGNRTQAAVWALENGLAPP